MPVDLGPYAGVRPFFGLKPTWLTDPADLDRIQAYTSFEAMYWNAPGAYEVIQRGSEVDPVYMPTPMKLIEARNRYLCRNWTFTMEPGLGSDSDRALLTATLRNLFAREKFYSKFANNRRDFLIRGDALFHITADPLKPEGRRISLHTVDPAAYFPITEVGDDDRLLGVHLVEQTLAADETTVIIKRQTYRKLESGGISYELTWWEQGAWDDRELEPDLKPAEDPPSAEIAEYVLPPSITSIPVYHMRNNSGGAPFGNSDLRGFESAMASISQTVNDGQLALALAGLGIYVTTSGPPVDEDGNETNWKIGPGYVAEIDPDADWKRVPGVTSVEPVTAMADYIEKSIREAAGVPDVAVGYIGSQDAESGVALALKFAPLLSGNEEKEVEILGTMDQFLYDLVTMWLPAYEGLVSPCVAVSVIGEPLPVNRKAIIDEVKIMIDAGLITVEYGRQILADKLGYDFPAEMGAQVVKEAEQLANARNSDPLLNRIGAELDLLNGGGTS